MSTTDGIIKWNPKTNTGQLLNQSIGLKNNEFNKGAALIGSDGTMHMGCIAGLVSFDPNKIVPNIHPPKVRLKDLQLFNANVGIGQNLDGQILLAQDIDFTKCLTLAHSHRVFSLVFDAINFRLPDQTKYAYQLVGLQNDWITTEFPLATFTNLDPGEYELRFRAANNDGIWSATRRLDIVVLPPWWMTWWAFTLYLILFAAGLWLFIHLRVRSVKKVEQVKQQTREAFRKRSRQDFHDEAGNKLTRIALITQVAKQQSKDEEQSKLIDEIDLNIKELESGMRDFIWVLNPDEDNLFDTFERVKQFAHSMYEYSETTLEMEPTPVTWKEVELNMEKRRNVMMIFKEAINNSVKYAGASRARISFSEGLDQPEIEFEDDGIGFEKSELKRKGGLDNMEKRAARIHAKISITSSINQGVRIKLKL